MPKLALRLGSPEWLQECIEEFKRLCDWQPPARTNVNVYHLETEEYVYDICPGRLGFWYDFALQGFKVYSWDIHVDTRLAKPCPP